MPALRLAILALSLCMPIQAIAAEGFYYRNVNGQGTLTSTPPAASGNGQAGQPAPDAVTAWSTEPALGTANAGSAVNQSLVASGTGSGTTTYAVVAGALPGGLTLSNAGVLGGTPANVAGTYTFTVRATRGASTLDRSFTMTTVADTLTWATAAGSLGSTYANSAFTKTLGATSSLGRPVTYAVTGGSLPVGITLTGATIGGTAGSATGTSSFVVTASDGVVSVPRSFTITVDGITQAATGNFSSARYAGGGNISGGLSDSGNYFSYSFNSGSYTLYNGDVTNVFTVNFNTPVTMKYMAAYGAWQGVAGLFVTEYLSNGSWVMASTNNGGARRWSTTPGSPSNGA